MIIIFNLIGSSSLTITDESGVVHASTLSKVRFSFLITRFEDHVVLESLRFTISKSDDLQLLDVVTLLNLGMRVLNVIKAHSKEYQKDHKSYATGKHNHTYLEDRSN